MFTTVASSSWEDRSRRGVTTFASFSAEVIAVAILLIVPLLRPNGLPSLRHVSAPVSLGQPGEAPQTNPHSGAGSIDRSPTAIILRPSSLRHFHGPQTDDGPAPQFPGSTGPYSPGTTGLGLQHGIFASSGTNIRPIMPTLRPAPKAAPFHVSQMSEGSLAHKVVPAYPPLAKSARIQGEVLLQALISKQGTIENLRVISGHPMLVAAAVEAVRQWRYRPYVLNGEPVEVDTQITVNFLLAEN
jgi:periplasmic protein TonB